MHMVARTIIADRGGMYAGGASGAAERGESIGYSGLLGEHGMACCGLDNSCCFGGCMWCMCCCSPALLADCGLLAVTGCFASNKLPILAITFRSSLSIKDGKPINDGKRRRSKLSLCKSGTTDSWAAMSPHTRRLSADLRGESESGVSTQACTHSATESAREKGDQSGRARVKKLQATRLECQRETTHAGFVLSRKL